MKSTSLKKQLFNSTAIVALVVMILSVMAIDVAMKENFEDDLREKLKLHVFMLLSVSQFEGDTLYVPEIMQNPQLNLAGSGLWAAAIDNQERVIWHSLSLSEAPPNISTTKKMGEWQYGKTEHQGINYLTASYNVSWDENGKRHTFHFVAGEDESSILSTIFYFRLWLLSGFAFISLTLLVFQHIALRKAFKPISRLENELKGLESGDISRLSGTYPKELSGVSENINLLLNKEHRQKERYRNCMADLAHSLKTPMALIQGELEETKSSLTLKKAVARIDKNIEYQLKRAVISGHSLTPEKVDFEGVLNITLEALQKLYQSKRVDVETHFQAGLRFPGDENDLLEALGNLLDNAFKYCHSKIKVTAETTKASLTIIIEDDGQGFDENIAPRIFERGQRLDTRGLGQGIGLAVVADIVASYNGCIRTQKSQLGGACFAINFPLRDSK